MKAMRLLCLAVLAGLFSCGKADYEYASNHVHFVYDNSIHLDATLASAMNAMAPGTFCHVWKTGDSHIYFEDFRKEPSKQPITATERMNAYIIGVYNESGIIVGFGQREAPPVFYAYDAQCPNCYSDTGLPRYLLTMDSSGKAACKQCSREYDLNNHGIIVKGDKGKKLFRYHASTSGPNGVLTVNN